MNLTGTDAVTLQFQFRQSQPIVQISHDKTSNDARAGASQMDKIEGLKEILEMDPKNSFARYGLAMELAGRGDTDAALAEFATLLTHDPDYTNAYFMAAQTLAAQGRTPAAIEQLKAGISCGTRVGNRHAVSEMQAMLDELDR